MEECSTNKKKIILQFGLKMSAIYNIPYEILQAIFLSSSDLQRMIPLKTHCKFLTIILFRVKQALYNSVTVDTYYCSLYFHNTWYRIGEEVTN